MPGPSSDRQLFADNVRRLRIAAGLTQEKLGWAADLDPTEIGRLEQGKRNPGFETIIKVARGLGVPPARLFDEIE